MAKRFDSHKFPDAVELLGGPAQAARELNSSIQAVLFWMSGERQFPVAKCPDVERLLGRAIRCEELRPDVDWATVRNPRAGVAYKAA